MNAAAKKISNCANLDLMQSLKVWVEAFHDMAENMPQCKANHGDWNQVIAADKELEPALAECRDVFQGKCGELSERAEGSKKLDED